MQDLRHFVHSRILDEKSQENQFSHVCPGQMAGNSVPHVRKTVRQTHTFLSHLPTLSGWVLCVSYYQQFLILPSWNNNVAGAQKTQHNWACSETTLNTNADVVLTMFGFSLSLNITPQR